MDEVLLAKMACGGRCVARLEKMACLTGKDSLTACGRVSSWSACVALQKLWQKWARANLDCEVDIGKLAALEAVLASASDP